LAEIDGGAPLLTNDNPTAGEWIITWLQEYRISELRDSAHESYERNININISLLIVHVRLKDLTGAHIQQIYNKLQEAKSMSGHGLSGVTVVKIKNIVSKVLQQAVLNKIIRANPPLESNAPKIEEIDIRIMTNAEQKIFISVLPFYNTGNMFAVALATGMRIGELCALEVGDIDRERKLIDIIITAGRRKDKYTGKISIKTGPPETKRSIRKIPLAPNVEVMLDRQAQLVAEMYEKADDRWNGNSLVFPTDEGNIHAL
jgi:integrase